MEYKNIDLQLLNDKKVVCTIHHIDIEKFKGKEKKIFINLINLLIIIMLYQRKQRSS